VAHVSQIARGLAGRATLTVDVNQAWDTTTARRYLPQLIDAGVTLIEQPVAKWNVPALKMLSATLGDRAAIMADETVCTPQDAMALAREQASQVFSLKVAKHGGLLRTREVAAVAEAADIGWYGGTMLETSIGSAASAHVFATLGSQHHGCELFGPQLLVDDIVTARMEIKDFELQLPDGPGFGVEVDLKQLDRFDRARTGLAPTHIDLGQQAAPKP
jgi:muconate cycloisomerase